MAAGSPSRLATCSWCWRERGRRLCFLLRDRDAKFTRGFDVFGLHGAEVLLTPVQAPNANAYAERWVRTVRDECLDWLLIVGPGHLEQVLRVYAAHYNTHRPRRALGLEPPDPPPRFERCPRRPAKRGAATRPARRPPPRVPTSCMNTLRTLRAGRGCRAAGAAYAGSTDLLV